MDHDFDALKRLVRPLIDSAHLYEEASVQVGSLEAACLFSSLALSRHRAVIQLREAAHAMGYELESEGMANGAAKHVLANFLVHIASRNRNAVVTEIEKSEGRITQAFEDALGDLALKGRTHLFIAELQKTVQGRRAGAPRMNVSL